MLTRWVLDWGRRRIWSETSAMINDRMTDSTYTQSHIGMTTMSFKNLFYYLQFLCFSVKKRRSTLSCFRAAQHDKAFRHTYRSPRFILNYRQRYFLLLENFAQPPFFYAMRVQTMLGYETSFRWREIRSQMTNSEKFSILQRQATLKLETLPLRDEQTRQSLQQHFCHPSSRYRDIIRH